MSTPLPERCIGQDFSVFLFLITFSLSLQKCLQIAFWFLFLYLYPLEQCVPSKCSSHLSIFNLLYHPPSLPPVPPLLLQASILKGVKFLPCIFLPCIYIFWKIKSFYFFLKFLNLVFFSLRTAKGAAKAAISALALSYTSSSESLPFHIPEA